MRQGYKTQTVLFSYNNTSCVIKNRNTIKNLRHGAPETLEYIQVWVKEKSFDQKLLLSLWTDQKICFPAKNENKKRINFCTMWKTMKKICSVVDKLSYMYN